jgi:hypothetical protein
MSLDINKKGFFAFFCILLTGTLLSAYAGNPIKERDFRGNLKDQAQSGYRDCLPLIWVYPFEIGDPTWTKPGVEKDTTIRISNLGCGPLEIYGITAHRITGDEDWLGVGSYPAFISDTLNPDNYFDLTIRLNKDGVVTSKPKVYEGFLDFATNLPTSPDTFYIRLIIGDSVSSPVWADIRTASKRITLNNAGNLGHNGVNDYSFDYFEDCDTANNVPGANDNAGLYLFDASPFILRISGTDTILNSSFWNADWLSGDGFRPLEGMTIDTVDDTLAGPYKYTGANYANTGKFVTSDSLIALQCEYFLPTHPDSSDFMVQRVWIWNNTNTTVPGVMIGELMDWDVPSDTGIRNGSGFDATRKLMYCYGGEYGADTGALAEWNDCVLADDRAGGMAYGNGFLIKKGSPATEAYDSLAIQGMFAGSNADWLPPSGAFPAGALYEKLWNGGALFSGYEIWSSPDPDSQYVDLNLVGFYGQFDLEYSSVNKSDTLLFIKIIATTNDQLAKGRTTAQIVDQARVWIQGRRGMGNCCNLPGDVNNNGFVQSTDITALNGYIYKPKVQFRPPCVEEADATGDGVVNALDVTRTINYLYKGAAAAICPKWTANKY